LVHALSLLQPLLEVRKPLQNGFGLGCEQLLAVLLSLVLGRLLIFADKLEKLLVGSFPLQLLLHGLSRGAHYKR